MTTRRKILGGMSALPLTMLPAMTPAFAQGAKGHMRVASVLDQRSAFYGGLDHFATRVKELSGGQMEITLYKNTLGKGERQLFEAVQLGTMEGTLATTGPLSAFLPEADLFNMPFLFKNKAHAFKVVDGDIGADFNQKAIAKGFRILGWWVTGTRNTSNRLRPINTPADFKGMKIRTMESPPFVAMYRALGATPVPMSITEVYTGLSQGTIDGIDGSLPAQLEFKHIEVLQYASITDHVVLLFPFVVSERWWQGQTEAVRSAIVTAEAEGRARERKDDEAYNVMIEQEWVKQGKKISHPDIAPFQQVASTIYPQFYDKIGGKALVERIQKLGEGL
jgi:tripartite ATP-independent transporter DctP family solute receptor